MELPRNFDAAQSSETAERRPARSASGLDVQIGAALKNHRMVAGLSQRDIADALQISPQQLQKYETGTNRVSFSRLIEVCQILGISVADVAAALPADDRHGLPNQVVPQNQIAFRDSRLGARAMAALSGIEDKRFVESLVGVLEDIARNGDEAAKPDLRR